MLRLSYGGECDNRAVLLSFSPHFLSLAPSCYVCVTVRNRRKPDFVRTCGRFKRTGPICSFLHLTFFFRTLTKVLICSQSWQHSRIESVAVTYAAAGSRAVLPESSFLFVTVVRLSNDKNPFKSIVLLGTPQVSSFAFSTPIDRIDYD